jgi:hypothetical protein
MGRVREQAIELPLDHRVALAGPCLQTRPVEHGDAATVALNQAGPLNAIALAISLAFIGDAVAQGLPINLRRKREGCLRE